MGNRIEKREYIGLLKPVTDLEEILFPDPHRFDVRKFKDQRPGMHYIGIDFKTGETGRTGGNVYVDYYEGTDIPLNSSPSRKEGNIAALITVETMLNLIPGQDERTLIEKYNDTIIFLLDTYRASHGAFVYEPTPAKEIRRA